MNVRIKKLRAQKFSLSLSLRAIYCFQFNYLLEILKMTLIIPYLNQGHRENLYASIGISASSCLGQVDVHVLTGSPQILMKPTAAEWSNASPSE